MEQKTKTTRRQQAEHTKLELFDAALRLLGKKDFSAITVRDIVREAGVSVGSFYNAYPSKLDVFYETYVIADRYFEEHVRPLLVQPAARDRILLFFERYAVYNSELTSTALTKVLYNSDNDCFHRVGEGGMVPILTQVMQYAKDSGFFRDPASAGEMAQFFMVAVRGAVYDWCIGDCREDLAQKLDVFVRRLMRVFR